MNKLEQRELSKKLYDELSDKGLVKKHGDIGFLIWKIAFGTACEYFLQTKENEPKKQCAINGVVQAKPEKVCVCKEIVTSGCTGYCEFHKIHWK